MSNEFIQVVEDEGEEEIELPLEDDKTLLLSTLQAQFPGACGLKYRNPETKSIRGIRLNEQKFYPPQSDTGWGDHTYICVFPKENKRKSDEKLENSTAKTKRIEKNPCSDLIVLGLPWKTTDQNLREHFEEYGELLMAQVKKDIKSGQPKGYGFIRFATQEAQIRVMAKRHLIGGRWCEVKYPHSKEGEIQTISSRIFVGRVTEDLTADDLRDYFSKFGEVIDVFLPKPFRGFAFVTFLDPAVARSLYGEDHLIKGISVLISNAAPKMDQTRKNQQYSHRYQQSMLNVEPPFSQGGGGVGGGGNAVRGAVNRYMQNIPRSPHNGWSSSSRNNIDMPNLQNLGIHSQGPSTPNPTPAPQYSHQQSYSYLNSAPIKYGGSNGSNTRPESLLQQGIFSAWLSQQLTGAGNYDMKSDNPGWSKQTSGTNTPQSTH